MNVYKVSLEGGVRFWVAETMVEAIGLAFDQWEEETGDKRENIEAGEDLHSAEFIGEVENKGLFG